MKSNNENEVSLEVLLASIYYLMTRYAKLPDKEISNAICYHLEMLSRHPDCDSEIIQKTGSRLAKQWRDQLHNQNNKESGCKNTYLQHSQSNIH
ncbi:MAG: hypothetical protein MI865_07505 [Proteobacteria bacterium]|nr:hypothetical protein [Pseudomonadota bacterium]